MDIPIVTVKSGPRHIVSGTDAAGNKVAYEITDEQYRSIGPNQPPPGLSYEEWHSGLPGCLGRYIITENRTVVEAKGKLSTFVLPGELAEEADCYLLGTPDGIVKIPKSDLVDTTDFTSLKDSTELAAVGITALTKNTVTVSDTSQAVPINPLEV